MDLLIKWNANVNHQTKNGNTPLMKAAINGHVEGVKSLLDKGAEKGIKNKDDKTAEMQCEEASKQEEQRKEKFDKKSVDKYYYTDEKKNLTRERAAKAMKNFKACLDLLGASQSMEERKSVRVAQLRAQMQECVGNEQYAEAALLQEQLQALERTALRARERERERARESER
jgi:hypothetical protein